MPKARRKRRSAVRGTVQTSQPRTEQSASLQSQRSPANNAFLSPPVRGFQSLIMPAMVAIGSWGLVFYFLFLTGEANHILFGGMAVLMALLWTFSFGIRIRKLLLQRART